MLCKWQIRWLCLLKGRACHANSKIPQARLVRFSFSPQTLFGAKQTFLSQLWAGTKRIAGRGYLILLPAQWKSVSLQNSPKTPCCILLNATLLLKEKGWERRKWPFVMLGPLAPKVLFSLMKWQLKNQFSLLPSPPPGFRAKSYTHVVKLNAASQNCWWLQTHHSSASGTVGSFASRPIMYS